MNRFLPFPVSSFFHICRQGFTIARYWLGTHIHIGRRLVGVSPHSLVFFPIQSTVFGCGLAGIVAYKGTGSTPVPKPADLDAWIEQAMASVYSGGSPTLETIEQFYLGGRERIEHLFKNISDFKTDAGWCHLFSQPRDRQWMADAAIRLGRLIAAQSHWLNAQMGLLPYEGTQIVSTRIERLKDIAWCMEKEILENLDRAWELMNGDDGRPSEATIALFRKVNAVLNSLDRLEVRGRDSAGISLMFVVDRPVFEQFKQMVSDKNMTDVITPRLGSEKLTNGAIHIRENQDGGTPTVTIGLVYKIAAEIGRLGDNVRFLRSQLRRDPILKLLAGLPHRHHTISSHTRWASVGAITEPNCHPVDNRTTSPTRQEKGIMHVCLNGDIDNYLSLKQALESRGMHSHPDITSDTKIIPLQIEAHLARTGDVAEAFRLALNDFEGSHAIAMHTDLAPGKLFLGQRGSGQAIFVGLAPDHYMAVSEVYGFVEETDQYLKLDGEKEINGKDGPVRGQLFILDQATGGGLGGITARCYDGTPIDLTSQMVKKTDITSRDIDRQGFSHYFLKEISESPKSVERTLQGRWRRHPDSPEFVEVILGNASVPDALQLALKSDRIRRIFFVGQGTAGVASQACADLTAYYLNNPSIHVGALKASEMSGFKLESEAFGRSMEDTVVVAISQSGTTTDTNRTVDMVRERGAFTLAIVNRRDSDLTFKVDGVLYTSSGRDIEMSVASTKAFYSQIVAGALLGLFMAALVNRRSAGFITEQIRQLIALPGSMSTVLECQDTIAASARALAPKKNYWATVGSGPNKAAADEIRIKLSELCYKTISSDYIEDKKHIDLSAEPLIIVCAAGTGGTVIGDIIKDTAIFKAHKATPVVIADKGEDRFALYAEHVVHVPTVAPHLSPVLNTLAGHLWGYYAALAINEGSRFLFEFQEKLNRLDHPFYRGKAGYL